MTNDIPFQESQREKAMRLFLQEYQYVEALAYRMSPVESSHGDIVHDVFTTFVQKADDFDLELDIRPLLYGMTRNIALRHWHRHLRTLPAGVQAVYRYAFDESTGEPLVYEESDTSDMDEQLTALNICMKKLTDKSAILIRYYYFDNLPYKEIARLTGQKTSTLQKIMCRLRDTLRKCIDRILKTGLEDS